MSLATIVSIIGLLTGTSAASFTAQDKNLQDPAWRSSTILIDVMQNLRCVKHRLHGALRKNGMKSFLGKP
jgi:hypothetical protein